MARTVVRASPLPLTAPRLSRGETGEPHPGVSHRPRIPYRGRNHPGSGGEGKQQLDGTTRYLGRGAHSGEGGRWTEPLRVPRGGTRPGLRLG